MTNSCLEVIPAPLASTSTSQTTLLTIEQRRAAKEMLASLDREANNAERASSKLERTVSDVKKLLRPDDLPSL